jgi:hypothetical protein
VKRLHVEREELKFVLLGEDASEAHLDAEVVLGRVGARARKSRPLLFGGFLDDAHELDHALAKPVRLEQQTLNQLFFRLIRDLAQSELDKHVGTKLLSDKVDVIDVVQRATDVEVERRSEKDARRTARRG